MRSARARSVARLTAGTQPAAQNVRWVGKAQLFSDVFERFPDGIVVVDRSRQIVARNAALYHLAAMAPDVEPPGTCCDLFGCRRPRTPLEDVCLSELVIGSRQPVSGILLQPPGGRAGPVWITASPLDDHAGQIMFQLRPAAADRIDQTTDRDLLGRTHLHVSALGPLQVYSSSRPLGGEWVGQRAGQLFKFLLTERHRAVPLEVIADAVWPNASRGTPNTVRHCIHVLRSRLDPDTGKQGWSPYILAENGCYRLNPDVVSVDVDEFEREIADGVRAMTDGAQETAAAFFEAAVARYRGDYLADEPYAEWTLLERERLRDLVIVALQALAEMRRDAPDVAVRDLERLAEMEPLDAEIQRQLMVLLIAQGRHSRAARQYRIFEQRLLLRYGEAPSFSLSDVAGESRVRWERAVGGDRGWISNAPSRDARTY